MTNPITIRKIKLSTRPIAKSTNLAHMIRIKYITIYRIQSIWYGTTK